MRYLFFIFALLTFIAPVNEVEAGNTISVNRGEAMKTLSWDVSGAPSCTPNTDYPNNGDGIYQRWRGLSPSATGNHTFSSPTLYVNEPISGTSETYNFWCTAGAASDTSTLVICNNTTHISDGGSSCVAIPAPTINSFSGPASVVSGTSPTLNWSVSDVTSCTINQGVGAANPATGGSVATPAISSATTYTLSCMNGAVGPTTRQVTVGITATAPTLSSPTVSAINQTGATLGATVTGNGGSALTSRGTCWGASSNPVSNCSAEGGTGVSSFSHARVGMTCGNTYYYRGFATNAVNTSYSSDGTFTTAACPVAPTLTLNAAPTPIILGGSSNLTWTVTGTADSCWASNGWTGWKATSGTNNEVVTPGSAGTYMYSLECYNGGVSSGRRDATVQVNAPAPVAGVCGPAATSYTSSDTSFSGAVCSAGTASPLSPAFPGQGGSTNWLCLGLNGGANSPQCTATRAAVTPAPAPGTVTATPSLTCGSKQITISWSSVPGAQTYQVYRNGSQVADQAALTFVDTVPTDGTNYSYTVGTWSAVGGLSSSQTTASPNPVTSPATCLPPTLTLNAAPTPIILGGSSNLTWTVTGTADSCWASNGWTGWKATSGTNNEVVTPGSVGTQTYSLECWNAGLSSGLQSVNVLVNPPVPNPPGTNNPPEPPGNPPVSAAMSGLCGGSIEVSWGPSNFATWYDISISNGAPVWSYSVAAPATSYTISGLPVNTVYNNIKVRARNGTGPSAPSGAVTATASNYCDELTVIPCTITSGNSCTVPVSWNILGATAPGVYNVTRSVTLSNLISGSIPNVTVERSSALGNAMTGVNTIQARDGATIINTVIGRANCPAAKFFHGNLSACMDLPVSSVTPVLPVVRKGKAETLVFRVNANYDLDCSIQGIPGALPIQHRIIGGPIQTYPVGTGVVNNTQLVRLTCDTPAGDIDPDATFEVKVNVIPDVREN